MGKPTQDKEGAVMLLVVFAVHIVIGPLIRCWALQWIANTYQLIDLSYGQWFGLSLLWSMLSSRLLEDNSDLPPIKLAGKIVGRWIAYPASVGVAWVWAHALGVL